MKELTITLEDRVHALQKQLNMFSTELATSDAKINTLTKYIMKKENKDVDVGEENSIDLQKAAQDDEYLVLDND